MEIHPETPAAKIPVALRIPPPGQPLKLNVMPIRTNLDFPLSVDDFLTKQNQTLLRDFSESGQCLVAVSPEKLKDMQRLWSWTVEQLPGCLPSSACIVKKGPNYEPECWARWDYGDYRKAFASYLSVCHPEFDSILSPNVHVDHLEPKFRFPKGDRYFVRLHLLKRSVNASYGAGFERNFYRAENKKALHGAIHMSWLAFCKARGILPPGKNVGAAAWQAWARKQAREFALESGESAPDAYAGLLAILQLGYTGFYSGEAEHFDFEVVRSSY